MTGICTFHSEELRMRMIDGVSIHLAALSPSGLEAEYSLSSGRQLACHLVQGHSLWKKEKGKMYHFTAKEKNIWLTCTHKVDKLTTLIDHYKEMQSASLREMSIPVNWPMFEHEGRFSYPKVETECHGKHLRCQHAAAATSPSTENKFKIISIKLIIRFTKCFCFAV